VAVLLGSKFPEIGSPLSLRNPGQAVPVRNGTGLSPEIYFLSPYKAFDEWRPGWTKVKTWAFAAEELAA
jgi:hypothetical protein